MAIQDELTPADEARVPVTLTVNGQQVSRDVSPRRLLSDFLRHDLRLTGTHVGCEHGVCGCCTVLIDDRAARSCLTLVVQAEGAAVRTVESLAAEDGELHPVQRAFRECHGLQCGFCTPGFLMSVVGHIEENPDTPTDEATLREALSGNLCRCTGYQNIVAAARRGIELTRGEA